MARLMRFSQRFSIIMTNQHLCWLVIIKIPYLLACSRLKVLLRRPIFDLYQAPIGLGNGAPPTGSGAGVPPLPFPLPEVNWLLYRSA